MIGGIETLGQRIAAGFAVLVALTALLAGGALFAIRDVTGAADRVLSGASRDLALVLQLDAEAASRSAHSRGYLLFQDQETLEQIHQARARFDELRGKLAAAAAASPEEQRLVDAVSASEADYRASFDRELERITARSGQADAARSWNVEIRPRFERLVAALAELQAFEERSVADARARWGASSARASALLVGGALATVLVASLLSALIARAIGSRIGTAVRHLQTSSTELQASASQQAATSREQATSTNEVGATVKELLASSRQIAESTQRVVRLAEQTGVAAHGGDEMLHRADDATVAIKRQVDVIVAHMLDLGRKAQQIGTVLEIIDELADQTNILSINASIEAAGAGEAGRRFSVVAEEIRKLADRVGSSTKEVRALVEDVRSASSTTIMATEQGLKATEAGTQRLRELTQNFERIASLVVETTDATREIELSTRQQATAVEQVNTAVLEVAESAGEVEAGARQTLAVVGQLATLARGLTVLVEGGPRGDVEPAR